MTLYEFIDMAVSQNYNCYIYDGNLEKNIFEGKICEIPKVLLDRDITSWEIEHEVIGFNIAD